MVGAGAPMALCLNELFLGSEEPAIAALELLVFDFVVASVLECGELLLAHSVSSMSEKWCNEGYILSTPERGT
jgi:hypothetical protein